MAAPRSAIVARPERPMASGTDANPADERRSRLMAAAQAGDRACYSALLRECVPFIRTVAARRVPPDRIDDVVQDVLLTIHRARQTYDPARSFTAWLHTITERRAVDIMRVVARSSAREVHAPVLYEQHVDETANPAAAIDRTETARQVRRAVAMLPPKQREAVQHLLLHEQSLTEAAQATGRGAGALKVNLHRAIAALRIKFERET
jgi:RNA polymerase sigma factor (sigma-70 family)